MGLGSVNGGLASLTLRLLVPVVGATMAFLCASADAQETACLPTGSRIVDASTFPALEPLPAAVYTTPRTFVSNGGRTPIRRTQRQRIRTLRREGFISGILQIFQSPNTPTFAFSIATQLGSPGQAAAEARRFRKYRVQSTNASPRGWKAFAVPEVPGARGLRLRLGGFSEVYFSDDAYAYVVTLAGVRVSQGIPVVRAAASSLFAKVHGSPVCP